jgi:hypothetical protein
MSKRAQEFLRNMTVVEAPATPPPPAVQITPVKPSSRVNLKHIGGYFDDEVVEMVAVLRARLKLDNSGLIKLALEDLYRKHNAKRAFGE